MTLHEVIDARFGGVLRHGKHEEDGQACALEAVSVARGVKWTDAPRLVGMPDLRPINDGRWSSDEARTEALVPVLIALWDWPDWSDARRQAWAERIVLRTVREVLPLAMTRWPEHAAACVAAETLQQAKAGAGAAAAAVAGVAAVAADAAEARAADAAARAESVLRLACRIWAEEATR